MNENVLQTIRSGMDGFSKGQKRIAAFILDNYDRAAFMTAARLGETASVSESTVVRFAAQLGYDGYPEVQKALNINSGRAWHIKKQIAPVKAEVLQALYLACVDTEYAIKSGSVQDRAALNALLMKISQAKYATK